MRAGVGAAVALAHRSEWAFVLAATVRVTRDLDLAEECVQDAYAQALSTWAGRGIPAKPGAWLTTVARRQALDLLRRQDVAHRALPLLVTDALAGPDTPRTPGHTRRPAPAHLHLLSSQPRPGGPGRAVPAPAVRTQHRRGRPGVPGQRAHYGGADHPGQEEDRLRTDPLPGPPAGRAARADRRRADRGAPGLQHGAHCPVGRPAGPRGPRRARPRPGPDAAPAPARGRRRGRAAGADPAHDARRATRGTQAGLAALDQLSDDSQLATYSYLASARADFLRRLGRTDEARDAYAEALLLTGNSVERQFLAARIEELGR